MILAGDVGATKILLEAGDFRSGAWTPVHSRRFATEEASGIEPVLATFLEELAPVRKRAKITSACLGIAGPVSRNKGRMTHRPWVIDGNALARRLDLGRMAIVNDLAASAHGIARLSSRDLLTIQRGVVVPEAPRVVLGVGTGLGVAYLIPKAKGGFDVVPGEGGHAGFSPASVEQLELWRAIFAVHGRVEAEHICSGRGLSTVYEYFARHGEAPEGAPEAAQPAWIVEGATKRNDAKCRLALDLFVECLGNVAGDHALSCLAQGGVYIAGGVAAKIAKHLATPRFLSAFCAKGAFSNTMMRMPVKAVTSERLPVIGAASVAASP